MAGVPGWARLKRWFAAVRARSPLVDHVARMVQHYGRVQGGVLAGGVTYFGFLSFFPLIALAFSVVGYVAVAFPDAEDALVTAIEQIFPGIVTTDGRDGTISLEQIANAKVATGLIGTVGLLYTGLGWLSGLRNSLVTTFEVPHKERRNFLVGKVVDLLVLVILGAVMIASVGVSGSVQSKAGAMIEAVGLSGTWLGPLLLRTLGIALGLGASTLLFFVMYRLLGAPDLPGRALWQGALLAAAGFEALKLLVVFVLDSVGGSAFAPLAIAVTLLLWINYFSRLAMYGAAWAMTSNLSSDALARRSDASEAAVAVADEADEKARIPVAHPEPAVPRFDLGSAALGAFATALAALIIWRRGDA